MLLWSAMIWLPSRKPPPVGTARVPTVKVCSTVTQEAARSGSRGGVNRSDPNASGSRSRIASSRISSSISARMRGPQGSPRASLAATPASIETASVAHLASGERPGVGPAPEDADALAAGGRRRGLGLDGGDQRLDFAPQAGVEVVGAVGRRARPSGRCGLGRCGGLQRAAAAAAPGDTDDGERGVGRRDAGA